MSMDSRVCSIYGCDGTRPEVKLHQLPSNSKRLLLWLESLRTAKLQRLPTKGRKGFYVCRRHFEKRFITKRGKIRNIAYPTLFTRDEVASGTPHKSIEDPDPVLDHTYHSNRRHRDHTYARSIEDEGLIGKEKILKDFMTSQTNKGELPIENEPWYSCENNIIAQRKENIINEGDISSESDVNEPNGGNDAVFYLTEVDENDPVEDNLVYLNEINPHLPTNDVGNVDYVQEVDNNEDNNIGYLTEGVGNDFIEDGNMVSSPEVDSTIVAEDANFYCSPESSHNEVTNEVIPKNRDFDMSHLSNKCRTCLCVMDKNRVHLERDVLLEQPTKLIEMLVSLGCVMDLGDDDWPQNICTECTKSVILAYNFKMKCLSSTQTLLHELTEIKSRHTENNNTTGANNEEYRSVLEKTVVQDSDFNESYEPENNDMDVDEETDMDDNCIVNEEYPISAQVRESIRCIKKGCDKKFAKVKSLIHHLAQNHPDERRSFCEKCSIGYASEKRLKERLIERLKNPSDSRLKENRFSTSRKCRGCGVRIIYTQYKSK